MNNWNQVRQQIGKGKIFEKVVYRRVNFKRDEQMKSLLDQFLDEVIGLEYNFSKAKVMRKHSFVYKVECYSPDSFIMIDVDNEKEKDRLVMKEDELIALEDV